MFAQAEVEGLYVVEDLPSPEERRRLRQRFGISNSRMASEIGVTVSMISLWDNGKRKPNKANRAALVAFYKRLATRERQMMSVRYQAKSEMRPPIRADVNLPELMGAQEIGSFLGVARVQIDRYARQAGFPVPVLKLSNGRIWLGSEIRAWAAATGRIRE